MAHLQDKPREIPFHQATDRTEQIEVNQDAFKKWQFETKDKYVFKEIIYSSSRAITCDKVPEAVVWNVYNIRCEHDAKFPNRKPTKKMTLGAVAWIKLFRKYTLAAMRHSARKEYVRLFNLPKWKNLRGSSRLATSFNDIKSKLKYSRDKEV